MGNKEQEWEIFNLELAQRDANRAWFYYLSDETSILEIAYRAWLIKQGQHLVLVDTGPPLQEGVRRGLKNIIPIDKALENIGVKTDQIYKVILTHLHWDHAASADLFPHALFYIQESEIEFFRNNAHEHHVTSRFFSHHQMLTELINSENIVPIVDNYQLYPGLSMIKIGGHTPGSQIVKVNTHNGLAVIAGDVIPLNRNFADFVPNGIFVNILDSIAGLKIVRDLNPSIIYTGHDMEPSFKPG